MSRVGAQEKRETQQVKDLPNVVLLIESDPSTSATPAIAPTRQCVVDTDRPSMVADRTVAAVPICAANPRENVNLMIFSPTVAMHLYPCVASPRTIPTPPALKTHHGGCSPKT
jgi:hypothetical protein